uniref:Uncharacterized protein n=1 Tax=Anguilla anguilla TaxID=7936 RepID=A0A0E9X0M0_ANGAN
MLFFFPLIKCHVNADAALYEKCVEMQCDPQGQMSTVPLCSLFFLSISSRRLLGFLKLQQQPDIMYLQALSSYGPFRVCVVFC